MLHGGAVLGGPGTAESLLGRGWSEIVLHIISGFQHASEKANPTPTEKCLHTFPIMRGSQAENIPHYPFTRYLPCLFSCYFELSLIVPAEYQLYHNMNLKTGIDSPPLPAWRFFFCCGTWRILI